MDAVDEATAPQSSVGANKKLCSIFGIILTRFSSVFVSVHPFKIANKFSMVFYFHQLQSI